MVVGAEEQSCDVRRGKSDEANWSAVGGDDSGQSARDDEQRASERLHVDTEVLGVVLPEEHGVEGFCQEYGGEGKAQRHGGEERQVGKRHRAERAHAPYHV